MRFNFFIRCSLLLALALCHSPSATALLAGSPSNSKASKLTRSQTVLSITPEGGALFGQEVTFTVRVAPTYVPGPLPTGSVKFFIDDKLVSDQPIVDNSAIYTTSSLPAALHSPHHINVVYSGDASYESSKDSSVYEVNPVNTIVSIMSSKNPAFWGEPVQFLIEVQPTPATGVVPQGSIQLDIEGNGVETLPLNSQGKASFSMTKLEVGDRLVKASFSGDRNFNRSSSSLSQRTAKTATKTVLTSTENPSLYGKDVVISATLYSPFKDVIPTGSVQFQMDRKNSGVPIAIDQKGTANITFSDLVVGNHTLDAYFSGDEHFLPAKNVMVQKVIQASTEIHVSSSQNPAPYGAPISIKAEVVSPEGKPEGLISLKIDGSVVDRMNVEANGHATFKINPLDPGIHEITALYTGTVNFSESSASLQQKIEQKKEEPKEENKESAQ